MVFLGSLSGSNTASIDNLTTTGLVTTEMLQIGPSTVINEQFNYFYYGLVTNVTVTTTGVTLTTVTVANMPSNVNIYVTARYTAAASTLPSVYSRVYDVSAGSFRVASRVDDETLGSFTASFYWVAMQ